MKTSQIRQAFFDYFTQRGHTLVPSSGLIPGNDQSLLFTNAGMVQFKDVFLGHTPAQFPCAVSSQRCLRAGGKHNDLDNVGYTARHHTFFEMLGNFSFGDYFKVQAIRFAWDFLTQVLKLPADRLWVTVHQSDDETADIWLKDMGVSPDRFSRCGDADNFWSMGEVGPCGPCTEIFYDHGPEVVGGPPGHPGAEGDRYVEIWNLVFMQYNRDKSGQLHPLPTPSVDTGMGLERIAAVVQGVHSNYQTDVFANLIDAIFSLTHGVQRDNPSLNVVADHLRACAFLIVDGVLPSNEGRGYVLRRIIRRAVRHGHQMGLGVPFFSECVPALVVEMADAYPELRSNQAMIQTVLAAEEKQFARTLDNGLRLLKEHLELASSKTLAGDVAFKLYDTYGFPLDLTQDMAREHNMVVDVQGFEECMQQQREKSQLASAFHADDAAANVADLNTEFVGYTQDSIDTHVIGLINQGERVSSILPGVRVGVILESTPFYAESGGQVGDSGVLLLKHTHFRVDDTQCLGRAVVHYGELLDHEICLHDQVTASVDFTRRESIRANHTATHLVHAALKNILGDHVHQRGSRVDAAQARFDFSHTQPLTADELERVELLVNQHIRDNVWVDTAIMDMDQARDAGAIALFGEKYGDQVRVLTMGTISKELCGGTHAQRTGDLGLFKITSEYSVASGVRRIEWVTGSSAIIWLHAQDRMIKTMSQMLKTSTPEMVAKLSQTVQAVKQSEAALAECKKTQLFALSKELLSEVIQSDSVQVLIKRLDKTDAVSLRVLLDHMILNHKDLVVVLFGVHQGKLNIVAHVNPALAPNVPSAVDCVRKLCGAGGGRDGLAQGGGLVPDDLDQRVMELNRMIVGDFHDAMN